MTSIKIIDQLMDLLKCFPHPCMAVGRPKQRERKQKGTENREEKIVFILRQ